MRRAVVTGLVLAGAAAASARAGPSESCLRAATAAEQRWALPPNLLSAIGRVESGRRDGATGAVQPWPWSANAAGTPYVFGSAGEAGAVVGFLRARGIASIDVGCFQVNLRHHPAAFPSVTQGFDPDTNADYAARFLRSLYERTGSWEAAVGDYHSADPVRGGDYRARVLRAWRGPPGPAPLVRADPHVILVSAAARRIPVYTLQTLPPALRASLGLRISASFAQSKPYFN